LNTSKPVKKQNGGRTRYIKNAFPDFYFYIIIVLNLVHPDSPNDVDSYT